MDNALEGRTYYRDKDGNEITQAEFERLQCGEPDAETESEKPKRKPLKNEGGQ